MPDTEDRDIEDGAFETSTPEANRSIDQGNGVGARELERQGSPTRAAEHDPFKEAQDEGDSDLEPPAGGADFA